MCIALDYAGGQGLGVMSNLQNLSCPPAPKHGEATAKKYAGLVGQASCRGTANPGYIYASYSDALLRLSSTRAIVVTGASTPDRVAAEPWQTRARGRQPIQA